MAIISVAQPHYVPPPQQRQEEDPLDRIIKGLHIATSIYGIKNSFDQNNYTALKAQRDEESARQGILSPKEVIAHADKLNFSNEPFDGSMQAQTYQAGKLVPIFYGAKEKEVDPAVAEMRKLNLENLRQGMSERASKAQEKALGKSLPATTAEAFGDANASYQALDKAAAKFDENKDLVGPFQGRLSQLKGAMEFGETGVKAKVFDAQLKANAQTIGKYLEGGKLTDADIDRYKQMLPNLSDSPEAAKGKTDVLKSLLASKQGSQIESLKQAGFNVGDIRVSQPPIKKVIDRQINEKSGKVRLVFDDGSTEITNSNIGGL